MSGRVIDIDNVTKEVALGTKRDATRRRLLDAGYKLMRERGYVNATAAAIAKEAGVTQRTFFRYFPSKADLLVANWRLHADAARAALAKSRSPELIEVVRAGLLAYAERLAPEFTLRSEVALEIYEDQSAYVAVMQAVLELEHDIAVALAARLKRSSEEFEIRLLASVSLGVLRAALLDTIQHVNGPGMSAMINVGLERISCLFLSPTLRKRPARQREKR